MHGLMNMFTSLILLAGLGFRGWLFFNDQHEDHRQLFRIWSCFCYPIVMLTISVQLLPEAGLTVWTLSAGAGMGVVWMVKNWLKPVQVSGAAADVVADAAEAMVLAKPFEPEQLINLEKGIFVGVDERRKPVYLPHRKFTKNHVEILGESGVGKSSFAGNVFSQLAALGETVVNFDPKFDRNLPGALARAGRLWGNYPFHIIDLRQQSGPQLNPFKRCREDQVDELLQVALDLGKTGDAGVDFYRGGDREATGFIAEALKDGRTSMLEILETAAADDRVTSQENLWRELRQLGRITAFHTTDGLDLVNVLSKPGILYVIGSTTDLVVASAQKLVLQRVLQIIDERKDADRPVSIFMDELKYLLSPAALRAAGTIRDRNCHLFFAHQSLADLSDCPGLNPAAVKGAIWGNCGIKFTYKMLDAGTATELETIAGTRALTTTSVSSDGDKSSVSTRVERGHHMPAHVFTHLPKPDQVGEASVSVVFGMGPAWFLSTRYIQTGPAPKPIPAPLEVRGPASATDETFGQTSEIAEADDLSALFE